MVYVEDWEVFVEKATLIFQGNPEKARFSTKYRHCDGRATLMVTDDAKCVQFRTEQSEDLRRIEEFNRLMVRLMSRGAAATEPTAEEQARYDQQGAAGSEAQGAGGRRGKKRR